MCSDLQTLIPEREKGKKGRKRGKKEKKRGEKKRREERERRGALFDKNVMLVSSTARTTKRWILAT